MSTTPRVPSAIDGADASFMTVLAHQPGLAQSFHKLYGTMWSHGVVDHVTKETIRLRNARVTDCGFCRNVRFSRAREDGLSEDVASLIDDGYEQHDLTDRQKLVLRYTDAYLRDAGAISADVTEALSAAFSPEEIVEMTVALSMFLGFAKMLISLGTEPEKMETIVIPTPDFAPV